MVREFMYNKKIQLEFILPVEQVTPERYYEMLECLPPIRMVLNAFLVGEATQYNKKGIPLYDFYFEKRGQYFYGGEITTKEFDVFAIGEVDIPVTGKTYALTGTSDASCIANGNTWAESKI